MDEMSLKDLEALRQRIDGIDQELVDLIDQRALVAHEIAKAKASNSNQDGQTYLRPEREAYLLRKLMQMPHKATSSGVINRIWRELMSQSLSIQLASQGGFCVHVLEKDRAMT